MSNRFVYFFVIRKQLSSGIIRESSGIAQLEEPIVSQERVDHLKELLGGAFPDMAPVEAISQLTYLHREKVADE